MPITFCLFVLEVCSRTGNADSFPDDQDFPPLAPPTKSREMLPPPRSRIESGKCSLYSSVRSSTPRVPPGLSLPHAHPLPSLAEDSETKKREIKVASSTPSPITPALPIRPIGHRPGSPRAKIKERVVTSKTEKNAKDIRLQETDNNNRTGEEQLRVAPDTAAKTTNVLTGSSPVQSSRATDVRIEAPEAASVSEPNECATVDKSTPPNAAAIVPPTRLDISAALAQRSKYGASPSKTSQHVVLQNLVATPNTIESLPSTPNASATKSPDWTSAGRPRTLRLTTTNTPTPKSEAAPTSAITERSTALSAAILTQISRQPSLSSISRSRPSTPTVSEHGTSTAISRAGSPPASDVVGYVPERNKSASQAKKVRKAKSRTTTESRDEESAVSTPPISEEVGPIISRQKKKKRTQERNTRASGEAASGVATEPEPGPEPEVNIAAQSRKVMVDDSGKSTKETGSGSSPDNPVTEEPKMNEKEGPRKSNEGKKNAPVMSREKGEQSAHGATQQRSYTLNHLLSDIAKLPETETTMSQLLNVSISATSKLLRELLESKDIDLNSAVFNAPPLTSYKLPSHSQKGAEYLDANGYTMTSPFGEIYLSGHDRKQLLQGRHVRLSDRKKPQNVLKRTMITPSGAIFRHLSVEEEERVMELENRMRENETKYGAAGKSELKPLDDMDFLNLTGGLQELIAFPQLHRISLLTAEPGSEGGEHDDVELGANGSDETEDEMAPLASGFGGAPEGPMRKPMTPNTMKRKTEALMAVNLRNLDVDKLQKRIRETQTEMEGARKEMEALEKKAARKAKDVAKWREALLKEMRRGV